MREGGSHDPMEGAEYRRLPVDERRALVAEAVLIFGNAAGRELADILAVEFEDCAEDIERLRYRAQ